MTRKDVERHILSHFAYLPDELRHGKAGAMYVSVVVFHRHRFQFLLREHANRLLELRFLLYVFTKLCAMTVLLVCKKRRMQTNEFRHRR